LLLDAGVASRRGIMTSHRETAYKEYSKDEHLPVSEDLADRSIILPLYYPMKEEDVAYVIEKFKSFIA